MKWTLVWSIILVCWVSGRGTAQTVKVTEPVQTLKEVFDLVELQTGMLTLFSNNELDMFREVRLEVREYALKELYESLLKGTNLEFEIFNSYVVIRPVLSRKEQKSTMYEVTGKVTDTEGEPLPGVAIVIRGSNRGDDRRERRVPDIIVESQRSYIAILVYREAAEKYDVHGRRTNGREAGR